MALRIYIYLCILAFGWVNTQIAESVSTTQLERSYQCWEAGITCKFGNIPPVA